MPPKQNNSRRQNGSQPRRKTRTKRRSKQSIGSKIGSFVGDAAQKLFTKITGFGDYTVNSNTLYNGTDPPVFTAGNRSIIIRHREYLGDITGSTAFSLKSYPIQPSLPDTFPWLSTVASSFEEYRFHGLVFEYKATSASALNSTNTALGTVVMATEYDVRKPVFSNKLSMENYEFAVSTKPSDSCLHPVECDPSLQPYKFLFTRPPLSVPSLFDLRTTDMANFQIATVGMQAASVIGELWCTYEIEFIKPKFDNIPNLASSVYYFSTNGPGISAGTLSLNNLRSYDGISMPGLIGWSSDTNKLLLNNPSYVGSTFKITVSNLVGGGTMNNYNYVVNQANSSGVTFIDVMNSAPMTFSSGTSFNSGTVSTFVVTITSANASIGFTSSGTAGLSGTGPYTLVDISLMN